MELGKYYIEQEMDDVIIGKAENGTIKAVRYSDENPTAYTKELETLRGFDSIREAERAAKGEAKAKTPCLTIKQYRQWDTGIYTLISYKNLTDAWGEPMKEERKSKE